MIPKKWALSSLLERSKEEKRPNFDVTRDYIRLILTIVSFISKYLPRPTVHATESLDPSTIIAR